MEWPDQYDFAFFGWACIAMHGIFMQAGEIILDAHALNRPFKPTLLVDS